MVDSGGDYFSVDSVLAEETAIPCLFQCGANGIGRALDPSSGKDITAIQWSQTLLLVYIYDMLRCHTRIEPEQQIRLVHGII